MQWFQTYLLPILLGILTTAFIFMLKWLFFEVFLPQYREWIYKGFDIDGTWKSKFPADRDPKRVVCEEDIQVKQLADHVSGNISYVEIRVGSDSIIRQKQFAFEGTFVDRVLSAQYWNSNRKDNGRGTFCLMVKDEDSLIGKYSWLDPDTHRVEASEYIWLRRNGQESDKPAAANSFNPTR